MMLLTVCEIHGYKIIYNLSSKEKLDQKDWKETNTLNGKLKVTHPTR